MDMGKLVITKSNADLLFIRLLETNFSEIWMNIKSNYFQIFWKILENVTHAVNVEFMNFIRNWQTSWITPHSQRSDPDEYR